MILCEWDAPEGDPGQSCVHLFARILSTSFSSVSIFSVCCYSIVSISMTKTHNYFNNLENISCGFYNFFGKIKKQYLNFRVENSHRRKKHLQYFNW
jgi:hypothetical protein